MRKECYYFNIVIFIFVFWGDAGLLTESFNFKISFVF